MIKKFFLIFSMLFLIVSPVFANTDYTYTTSYETNASTSYEDTSAQVSLLNSLPESQLGLTNILNILLVVIGILLILLGIAILIRLKS